MNKPNETAMQIYEYIKSEISTGVPPSVRDICESLHIRSTSTVQHYLVILEEAELIERADNKRRTICLPTETHADVPLLGTVAAGQPITAIQDIVGYVSYSGFRGDPSELFALNVQGDSMINIGMLDGDIIIVRQSPVARNGQLVVAMVDDSATVKRFYKEDGHFRLQPENDTMAPMFFDEVTILGIVVASIRQYE